MLLVLQQQQHQQRRDNRRRRVKKKLIKLKKRKLKESYKLYKMSLIRLVVVDLVLRLVQRNKIKKVKTFESLPVIKLID